MKRVIREEGQEGGMYPVAVEHGGLLYLSGIVAEDSETGAVVHGDITREATLVFQRVEQVLAGRGLGLGHVLRVEVYLADMADYDGMNAVYRRFFPDADAARHTVQVAGLYDGLKIEVVVIAAAEA